jgi:hypothetical protein
VLSNSELPQAGAHWGHRPPASRGQQPIVAATRWPGRRRCKTPRRRSLRPSPPSSDLPAGGRPSAGNDTTGRGPDGLDSVPSRSITTEDYLWTDTKSCLLLRIGPCHGLGTRPQRRRQLLGMGDPTFKPPLNDSVTHLLECSVCGALGNGDGRGSTQRLPSKTNKLVDCSS